MSKKYLIASFMVGIFLFLGSRPAPRDTKRRRFKTRTNNRGAI